MPYVTLKTTMDMPVMTEAEEKQCAIIKYKEGTIRIMPSSYYARYRFALLESLMNATFEYSSGKAESDEG